MPREQFPHKILWLASYPKSGNTWFRAFLTALLNDGAVDINNMDSDGIFSSRYTFDLVSEIESRDLYDEEAKLMLAGIYRQVAIDKEVLSIVKVHDAFGSDLEGNDLIPRDVTHCAIYFIRNPLDIVGSLANHMHFSMDEAIHMLGDKDACMAPQPGNLNKNMQFAQHLSDWAGHVSSWTVDPPFPVHVMRYEDMLTNTFETFSKALGFIGWQYAGEQISKAIAAADFDRLSQQETEKGFKEKARKSARFFRSGTMGNWQKELTPEQVSKMILLNKDLMEKYQYVKMQE
jgi:sulfotransferase family protein